MTDGRWKKGKRSKTKNKTKFSNTFFASIRSATKDENLCNQSRKFDGSSFFIHENFASVNGRPLSFCWEITTSQMSREWMMPVSQWYFKHVTVFFIPFMKLLLLAIDQSAHQFDYPRQSFDLILSCTILLSLSLFLLKHVWSFKCPFISASVKVYEKTESNCVCILPPTLW